MFKKLFLVSLAAAAPFFGETNVVAIAGSTRNDSMNKKLLNEAVEIAREMGANVTVVDLKDYPMPFYDGDLEQAEGMPANAQKLRQLLMNSQAILIASPEYNSSVSAVLKNAIDWASRTETGGGSREAFEGKKVALMSASPGRKGGARGLVHLKTILEDVHAVVLSKQVSVPEAYQAFNEEGALNPTYRQELKKEIEMLLKK